MNVAELFRVLLVAKLFAAKLLACKVKEAVAACGGNNVVAVVVSAVAKDAVDFSAKNVLRQKGCD